ncbi:hypothetical protein [Streptomyces sp. NBC_00690]|uniref:hypothetical protein n=1 Tax=Streptomyces sp. NBC_00690 TaxID=2975808 RepID=UPI002E2BDD4F|nr:hypothetical protein [Streptomyces sp. NBC_00690]
MDTEHGAGADEDMRVFPIHALPISTLRTMEPLAAEKEVEEISAVLAQLGGQPVDWELGLREPDLAMVDARLADWAAGGGARTSAVLWIGHGQSKASGTSLLVPGVPGSATDACFVPQSLARHLHDESRRRHVEGGHWVLVVVEACGAAGFVEQVATELGHLKATQDTALLLIASGADMGTGYRGAFRRKITEVLDGFTDQDLDIDPLDLAGRLGKSADFVVYTYGLYGALPLRRRVAVPCLVSATVQDYGRLKRLLAGTMDSTLAHFLRNGMGSGFAEMSWGFTGRGPDLEVIADWAHNPSGSGVLIVTGSPGAGKSALLGNVLLHAHRDIGQALAAAVFAERLRPDLRLPDFDAVLHLTGSTLHDITGQVASAFGAGLPDQAHDTQERIAALIVAAQARAATAPVFLLADALDESREPMLVAGLLREIASVPGVRLLLGTRSSAQEQPSRGQAGGEELLDALGCYTGRAQIHRLRREPQAVRTFVELSLGQGLGDRYATGPDPADLVGRIADLVRDRIADGSWEFLQASLVVQEILRAPDLLEPGRTADLEALLAHDQHGLFNAAVARITRDFPPAGPLLAALAHARGRGLPRADQVWATVAGALAEDGTVPADADISTLLHHAAAYVLLDGDDRRSVYRLAHRTFSQPFLADDSMERRLSIVTALASLAADRSDAAPRAPLNGYLCRHLSGHAADAGPAGWRELARYRQVLDRIDIPALAVDVLGARLFGSAPGGLPGEVAGTFDSADLIRASSLADRPGLRQLGTARATGGLPEAGPEAAWKVCWSRVRRHPPHLKLNGHSYPVSALRPWGPGSPLIASGSEDGTTLLWNPWTDHTPVTVLPGPADIAGTPGHSVLALATVYPDGDEGLLAVAHQDRRLRMWDSRGRPFADEFEIDTPTFLTGMTVLNGDRRRLAMAGWNGYLALLDPHRPGIRPRTADDPFGGRVHSLAAVTGPDGEPRLVTGIEGGSLALWDASGDGPRRLRSVRTGTEPTSLAVLSDAPGHSLVAVANIEAAEQPGRADASLHFWTLSGNDLVPADAPLHTCHDALTALTVLANADGTPRLVTAGREGSMRLWDPGRRSSMALLRKGASKGITRITPIAGPSGQSLLATSGPGDRTLRIWDPSIPDSSTTPAGETYNRRVAALARGVSPDGVELVLITETDGTVRACSAADGSDHSVPRPVVPAPRTATPVRVHTSHEDTVTAFTRLSRDVLGRPAEASGSADGTVRLWDMESGHELRVLRLGSACRALAALDGGRLAVALDDGLLVVEITPDTRRK